MECRCTKCDTLKPIDSFRFRNSRSTYDKTCKECQKIRTDELTKLRIDSPKLTIGRKICRVCGFELPIDNFCSLSKSLDGHTSRCKSCDAKYRASRYNYRSKDRLRKNVERYRKSHSSEISDRKKQKRLLDGDIVRAQEKERRRCIRKKALDLLGGQCIECQDRDIDYLCIDHVNNDGNVERKTVKESQKVYSRILNGTVDEYQILCANHNREKHLKYVRSLDRNDSPLDLRERLCSVCKKIKMVGEFSKDKYKSLGRKSECKDCYSDRSIQRKTRVMKKLGGHCALCRNDNLDHLEVDHINDDGSSLRKSGDDSSIYLKIMSGVYDFGHLQILCCNCNMKKSRSK